MAFYPEIYSHFHVCNIGVINLRKITLGSSLKKFFDHSFHLLVVKADFSLTRKYLNDYYVRKRVSMKTISAANMEALHIWM